MIPHYCLYDFEIAPKTCRDCNCANNGLDCTGQKITESYCDYNYYDDEDSLDGDFDE